MKINEIALRRKNMVMINRLPKPTINPVKEQDNDGILKFVTEENKRMILAATVAKNMESLGYTPDKELFTEMINNEQVTAQVSEYIIPELIKLKGADVEYKPMYPNFPQQVMDAEEAELYINAIIHYISGGNLMPEYNEKERSEFNEEIKLTKLSIGNEKAITEMFSNILNSVVTWTPQDQDDITTLASVYNIKEAMPKFITNRENVAILANKLANEKGVSAMTDLMPHIKTVTDVLRIMNVRHGNGSASLANTVKIGNMSRPERKIYLNMINHCKNAAEDMKINKTQWIKIGEKLHPGEFKDRYPKAFKAFDSMRNKDKVKEVKTYNAKTEAAIASNDISELRETFEDKPGMLARNLDRLLRDSKAPNDILNLYKDVATKVSPNLLWQVYAHFDRKVKEFDNENKMRIFVIKGEKSKTVVKKNETTPISIDICETVKNITEDALKELYKDKPEMGSVYIDPEVAKCKVPNDTRGASKGSVSIAKGSRLPLNNNANTIRGFIWWTNLKEQRGYSRTDIDLSCAFLDKNLSLVDRVSYYELKTSYACHSGDITNGGDFNGKGVAEFLDIDIEKAKEAGVKYAAMTVHSYSGQPYKDMEHIRFGFMEREELTSGEIFEPSTVKQSIKLSADSTTALTCMFDLESREMIWIDDIGHGDFRKFDVNNLDTNLVGLTMTAYKAIHLEKPDIYDVIRVNVEARGGKLVDEPGWADLTFALDGDIKPTDLEYFSGNLIPEKVSEEYEEKVKEEKILEEEKIQENEER